MSLYTCEAIVPAGNPERVTVRSPEGSAYQVAVPPGLTEGSRFVFQLAGTEPPAVTAQPVVAQGVPVPPAAARALEAAGIPRYEAPSAAQTAQWEVELFACNDASLCLPAFVCSCSTTGQLASKAIGAPCLSITTVLWVLFITQLICQHLASSLNSYVDGSRQSVTDAMDTFAVISFLLMSLSALVRALFLFRARRALRRTAGIRAESRCKDAAMALCCFPCVTMQMLRQLGFGIEGETYPGPCEKDRFQLNHPIRV